MSTSVRVAFDLWREFAPTPKPPPAVTNGVGVRPTSRAEISSKFCPSLLTSSHMSWSSSVLHARRLGAASGCELHGVHLVSSSSEEAAP
eukprot:CAMPEP_0181214138 /NCGR_PEP_ID=MMETSP1096-20121128/25286_1 /TAXON_ID=156174 ORGANISM="Chrysochromulina ericina, Strain CCMP281" /NCGR_SAMPLE_ID=MMETSP1096 /ASSEMBLY_ACC=CAM_ASM_000453 /LENGTH=88 /DNA_ID=CAMNT_0023305839 /DNA_START=1165 /DNA_END=1428 /DNA_ORIENTATION=-